MSTVMACSISILALFGWTLMESDSTSSLDTLAGVAVSGALSPIEPASAAEGDEGWLKSVVAQVIEAGQSLGF